MRKSMLKARLLYLILGVALLSSACGRLWGTVNWAGSGSAFVNYSTCATAALAVGSLGNISPSQITQGLTYSVSPTLPTGLNFNGQTGVISGTPIGVSGPTTYTISSGTFSTTLILQTVTGYVVNDLSDAAWVGPGCVSTDAGPNNCTLRAAIGAANHAAPGTYNIVFNVEGTISFGSVIDITNSINVYGTCPGTITLDGGGTQSLFLANTGNINISMQSLILQNAFTANFGATFGTNFNVNVNFTGNYLYFYHNSATTDSGALDESDASDTLVCNNCVFDSNTTGGDGGASEPSGDATFNQCLFVNNTSTGGGFVGGALSLHGAANSVVNSTFYSNASAGEGGALYVWGATTVTNNTFVNNVAAGAGHSGGISGTGGAAVTATNNLLYNNTGAFGQCDQVTITSHGGNDLSPAATHCVFGQPTDISIAPTLGPYQNNGGYSDTLALLAGSAGLDVGVVGFCPAVDQRGDPRHIPTSCDIGAYEHEP
jgi:hypothetical protein